MIRPTPIPPAARIAAKLRFRERWTLILTVAMVVVAMIVSFAVPGVRPAPPRARSRAERDQLLQSGTCIVQETNGALIGKLIGRSPPYLGRAYVPPRYFIEDARVRTTRTVDVSGTRGVPCSSIHEP
jgi:hypothetical protein